MAGAAVAVEGVWKYFGDFPALRDLSLTVDPQECVALLGRNGAGKTTLLRIIAGLSRATRGVVRIFGAGLREDATRRATGILGHGIGIYDELSALENLTLFGRLYGLADPRQSALDWLERTGLLPFQHAPAREFSRGMRQRLAVARAFLHDPRLLLLDEPFTALDDRAVALLQALLRERLNAGATIIMSTHQLREALELATSVALMQRGKLAFRGPRTPEMVADPGWIYRTHGEAV